MHDDKDMKYNKELSQYVLDKNYVLNNAYLDEHVEVELRSNKRFERLLVEVSDDIYRFIYRNSQRHSIPAKKYLIENDPDTRNTLKRAMLFQVRYNLRSGGGILKDMIGVDLERSRVINLDELRGERSIAAQAVDILYESPYLLYMGHLSILEVKHHVQHKTST